MFKLFLAGLFLILSRQPALAQGEFTTNYQVDYAVDRRGLTEARLNVELVNKLSNIYASEFSLSIGSTSLKDIRLSVGGQNVEPRMAVGDKTTNITVVFPEKVLGKDKSQQFSLSFTTADFARRTGNIWEVSIPRLARSETLDNYRLTLSVPGDFGRPAAITPQPVSQTAEADQTVYRFGGESLFKSGISATFGEVQYFRFNLDYHLANPRFYPVATEIALPPDTAWQQVFYEAIDPEPVSIRADDDGNWLAGYQLAPSSSLTVTASGSAATYLKPRPDFPKGRNPAVDYLRPLQYWEDNPQIRELAARLRQPREIYDYVVENLIYDYGRLSSVPVRLGAANVLDNRNSALCMEFTDLFVALSRVAGIPARAVNGYAFTDNPALRPLSLQQDVLHAWPEYYDQDRQLWRPVDPTWGNTTGGVDYFEQLDLNHLTFAILGNDSGYPVPAGAYKTDGRPAKNVHVSFGPAADPRTDLKLELDLPGETLAGLSVNGKIKLKNRGNAALYRLPVNLAAAGQNRDWELPVLPPLSTRELDFILPASAWNQAEAVEITVAAGSERLSHRLRIQPVYRYLMSSSRFRLGLLAAAGALFMLKFIYARMVKAKSAL